ncbi:MAG: cytochrome c maturation protein CcmE [Rhodanobacteraceae bacterium]|nr:cytochrome c maturation protein CcmE [Rhodanobacteraceae bacterium]MBL0042249.1 cytochrome c maturation protein CcmE [Xanthomonadales bacterium]MBP6079106.1 cytochrome c maturation protein CcmE [Xanthomonadales bacterium]MBP7623550.1 cytochrome c maturation protein CcmE [Xanthomonadales bacterium]
MNPIRRRRLVALSIGLLGLGIAAGFVVYALRENMQHFISPSDIALGKAPQGHRFRLGGVVLEGSVKRSGTSLDVDFIVTDRFKDIPVRYTGILPDLFREGQSVVATGTLEGQTRFLAEEVLAKHDENYMPAEVADAIAKAKAQKDATR